MSLGDEDETNLLKSLEPWILLDRQLSTFGSMKIPIAFIIYMRLRITYSKLNNELFMRVFSEIRLPIIFSLLLNFIIGKLDITTI